MREGRTNSQGWDRRAAQMPNLGLWTLSVDNPPPTLFGDRSGHVYLVKKDQVVAQ